MDRGLSVLAALVVVAAAGLSGCQRGERAPLEASEIALYAQLTLTRQTASQPLADELARIEAAGELPLQLAAAQSEQVQSNAAELAALLSPFLAECCQEEAAAALAGAEFRFAPARTAQQETLLRQHGEFLTKARRLLQRPNRVVAVDLRLGFAAPTEGVDNAVAAALLEGCAAAVRLDPRNAELTEAIDAWERMLAWARSLSAARHPIARLRAVEVRREALRVLSGIAAHGEIEALHLARCRSALQRELDAWSPDAETCIADRAIGLHSYELVRDGHLLSLLSLEEIRAVRQEGTVHATVTGVARTVDDDERFYLTAMRDLIAACDRPYHLRVAMLDEIERRLDRAEETPEFPFVAAHILLVDLRESQLALAEDRAQCELWLLALSAALSSEPTTPGIDPVSGGPYQLAIEAARVVARRPTSLHAEGEQIAIVPRL